MIITPKDKIEAELIEIDNFLNTAMSEDGTEAVQRGNELAIYIARSGKLVADAKYHLNEALKDEVFDILKETAKNAKATSKAVNAIIDSICKEERYLVDWSDRINRTATHQLSWCVTVVSKAKEEMRMAGYGNNMKS
ncbi:hypothetical protein [uncultured Bacteroides sp.]|uniref:hypothetical protein n=1 Tax=uncultured Bacteroides sp. TaxID=162156 RepID=UPI002AA7353F|nr:hypothetical protein [uncultured Bacteroides sp.]